MLERTTATMTFVEAVSHHRSSQCCARNEILVELLRNAHAPARPGPRIPAYDPSAPTARHSAQIAPAEKIKDYLRKDRQKVRD
jgi:hypothetical protein